MNRVSPRLRALFLLFLFVWLQVYPCLPLLAGDLPTAPSVTYGEASFSTDGPVMTITTPSDRVIIHYDSFDIGEGHTVQFIQPGSSAVALNRVTGNTPSSIFGLLSANGGVILINPNGIVFGKNAQVDCQSFLASTLDVRDEDFIANRPLTLTAAENMEAKQILNEGRINVGKGGEVHLIAGEVINKGTISAPDGFVGLVAGNKVIMRERFGQAQVTVPVEKAEDGTLKSQNGKIVVRDGKITFKGASLYDAIEAPAPRFTFGMENGRWVATESGGRSTVRNEGKVNASHVQLSGGAVVQKGTVEATRNTGSGLTGGRVFIGSTELSINGGNLLASGREGGTVDVLSGGTTLLEAESRIEARGRENGGAIEISGRKKVQLGGVIKAGGGTRQGSLLIDPDHIEVVPVAGVDAGVTYLTAADFDLISSADAFATLLADRTLLISNVTVNSRSMTLQAGEVLTAIGSTFVINDAAGEKTKLVAPVVQLLTNNFQGPLHVQSAEALVQAGVLYGTNNTFEVGNLTLRSLAFGSLDLTASGTLLMDAVTASGPVRIDAGGLTITNSVFQGSTVLASGGNLVINGVAFEEELSGSATNYVGVTNATFGGLVSLAAGGDLFVTNAGFPQEVTLTSGQNLTVRDGSFSNLVTIKATNNVLVREGKFLTDSVVEAGGNLVISNAVFLDAATIAAGTNGSLMAAAFTNTVNFTAGGNGLVQDGIHEAEGRFSAGGNLMVTNSVMRLSFNDLYSNKRYHFSTGSNVTVQSSWIELGSVTGQQALILQSTFDGNLTVYSDWRGSLWYGPGFQSDVSAVDVTILQSDLRGATLVNGTNVFFDRVTSTNGGHITINGGDVDVRKTHVFFMNGGGYYSPSHLTVRAQRTARFAGMTNRVLDVEAPEINLNDVRVYDDLESSVYAPKPDVLVRLHGSNVVLNKVTSPVASHEVLAENRLDINQSDLALAGIFHGSNFFLVNNSSLKAYEWNQSVDGSIQGGRGAVVNSSVVRPRGANDYDWIIRGGQYLVWENNSYTTNSAAFPLLRLVGSDGGAFIVNGENQESDTLNAPLNTLLTGYYAVPVPDNYEDDLLATGNNLRDVWNVQFSWNPAPEPVDPPDPIQQLLVSLIEPPLAPESSGPSEATIRDFLNQFYQSPSGQDVVNPFAPIPSIQPFGSPKVEFTVPPLGNGNGGGGGGGGASPAPDNGGGNPQNNGGGAGSAGGDLPKPVALPPASKPVKTDRAWESSQKIYQDNVTLQKAIDAEKKRFEDSEKLLKQYKEEQTQINQPYVTTLLDRVYPMIWEASDYNGKRGVDDPDVVRLRNNISDLLSDGNGVGISPDPVNGLSNVPGIMELYGMKFKLEREQVEANKKIVELIGKEKEYQEKIKKENEARENLIRQRADQLARVQKKGRKLAYVKGVKEFVKESEDPEYNTEVMNPLWEMSNKVWSLAPTPKPVVTPPPGPVKPPQDEPKPVLVVSQDSGQTADGNCRYQTTSYSDGSWRYTQVDYLPDGSRQVWIRTSGGGHELYVYGKDRQITHQEMYPSDPTFWDTAGEGIKLTGEQIVDDFLHVQSFKDAYRLMTTSDSWIDKIGALVCMGVCSIDVALNFIPLEGQAKAGATFLGKKIGSFGLDQLKLLFTKATEVAVAKGLIRQGPDAFKAALEYGVKNGNLEHIKQLGELIKTGAFKLDDMEDLIGDAVVEAIKRGNPEMLDEVFELLYHGCFAKGTLVWTETGLRPIEGIQVGDKVYASNPETGEIRLCPVERVFVREVKRQVTIAVGHETLRCSPEHPFWVKGQGWVCAGALSHSGIFITSQGKEVPYAIQSRASGRFTVYNIEVSGLHTFYVGQSRVLVHNKAMKAIKPGVLKGEQNLVGLAEAEREYVEYLIRNGQEVAVFADKTIKVNDVVVDVSKAAAENAAKVAAERAIDAANGGAGAAKDASKVFGKEKQALVDMAKADKRAGMTKADMEAYKDLNKQLPDPFPAYKVRGPEVHPNRGPQAQQPHGHFGPVDYIPIKDAN